MGNQANIISSGKDNSMVAKLNYLANPYIYILTKPLCKRKFEMLNVTICCWFFN